AYSAARSASPTPRRADPSLPDSAAPQGGPHRLQPTPPIHRDHSPPRNHPCQDLQTPSIKTVLMLRQCQTYIKTVLMPISLVEQRIRSEFDGARLAKSSASTTWDRGTGPSGWEPDRSTSTHRQLEPNIQVLI